MLPLGGCLLTGERPDPALDIPPSYTGSSPKPAAAEAALPPLDWWTKFHSRELTALIEEARSANLDIAAAIARIVQADAQARITGAALLPDDRSQRRRHSLTVLKDDRPGERAAVRR